MNSENTNNSSLPVTFALFALMVVYGASVNMIGPLMPKLLKHYGISMAGGGTIVSIQNLSGLAAVVFCGLFGDALNKKAFIGVGIALFMIALLSIGSAPPFSLLLAIFFVYGLGARGFDTLSNALISDLHGVKRSFFLNMLHMFFSFGAFSGPLVVYAFERVSWPWQRSFLVLGLFALLILAAYIITASWRNRLGNRTAVRENTAGTYSDRRTAIQAELPVNGSSGLAAQEPKQAARLLFQARIWVLGVVIFIHMGVQGVFFTWLPLFTSGSMGGGSFISVFTLSVLWIGIIFSRSLLSRLARRFGEIFLIRWGSLASVITFVPALVIGNAVLLTVSSGLVGLFIGFTIPFVMSVGCGWYPEKSAAVTSMLYVFGLFSVVVFPWLAGLLGDAYGLMAAMILIVVSQSILFAVSWLLPGKQAVQE